MKRPLDKKCNKMLLNYLILFMLMVSCSSENFSLPNLQILMQKNVIFPNMTLNQQSIISSNNSNKNNENTQNHQNNQKTVDFQYKLLYQMFVYPFDIYSYMNGINSKEYLFVRIDYDKFKQVGSKVKTNQNQSQNQKNSNLFQKEQKNQQEKNIRLTDQNGFKETKQPNNNNDGDLYKNAQNQTKTKEIQKISFEKEMLFQLIPRFLTIHAEQHEEITIKRVNQNFIMVINTARQVQKHQMNFFKMLTLYRLNLHPYIYYTRQEFLNQFYTNNNENKDLNKNQTPSVLDKIQNNFKTLHDIQEQLINLSNNLNFSQKFYHAEDIWYKMFSKNNQLLYRLFYQEARYYINKQVLQDYTFNEVQFKLVTIENRQCPEQSPLTLNFSIFENQQTRKLNQTKTKIKNCTYMNIFTKVFSTWKDQKSVQFICSQKQLQNIKFIQLAYHNNKKSQSSLQQKNIQVQDQVKDELLIGMGNQHGTILISYSQDEKKVLMYQENPNIKGLYFVKYQKVNKIAFITQNSVIFKTFQPSSQISTTKTKIKSKADSFQNQITKDDSYKEISYQCRLQFLPEILTISQINHQLLAVCRQGSFCQVINSNCEVVAQIGFDNAYGVQFSYKVRYLQIGKIQIYIQALKYSTQYRQIFPAPFIKNELNYRPTYQIDQTQIGLVYKKQDQITFQVKQITVVHSLIQKSMVIADNSAHQVIIPSFYKQQLLMRIKQPQLFQDQTYANIQKFRINYLEKAVIENELQSQIYRYLNPIGSSQSFKYLEKLSQKKKLVNKKLVNKNKFQAKSNSSISVNGNEQVDVFKGCKINILKEQIQFQQNWNMCKLTLTPHSFLVLEPSLSINNLKNQQIKITQNYNNGQINKNNSKYQTNQNQKVITQAHLQSVAKAIQKHLLHENSQNLNYFQKKIVQKANSLTKKKQNNLIFICSVNLNGQIHEKCLTHKYNIDKEFYEIATHLRIGLASGKIYFIYFFNSNSYYEYQKNSYKKTIDEYSRNIFFQNLFNLNKNQSQKQKQKQSTTNLQDNSLDVDVDTDIDGFIENKEGYFFQVQRQRGQKVNSQSLYNLQLLDIQKIQIQYMQQLIFLIFIVFTVLLVIICCIFMLKNLCFQILIYYDYINVQPAYIYPLGRLPLKIKIKKLIKRGYLTIVKRKNLLKQTNQVCTKFGQECCFCLQEINASEDLVELYCKHRFHSSCFFQWIRNQVNTKCPLCKRQFTQYALRQYERAMNQLKIEKNQSLDSEVMVEF